MSGRFEILNYKNGHLIQARQGHNLLLLAGKNFGPTVIIANSTTMAPATGDYVKPAIDDLPFIIFGDSAVAAQETQDTLLGNRFDDISIYTGNPSPSGWQTTNLTVTNGLSKTPPEYTITIKHEFTNLLLPTIGPIREIIIGGFDNELNIEHAASRFLPVEFTLESGSDLVVNWVLEFGRI